MDTKQTQTATSQIIWRGIKGKCPHCGQGNLLRAYLKQNDTCAVCGEDFSNIRADDAPPWLTILITGHIIAPIMLYCAEHNLFDGSVIPYVSIVIFSLVCAFTLLPLAKGFFIAAIWLSHKRKA